MNGWLVVNNFIDSYKFKELYNWFIDASKKDVELSDKNHRDFVSILGKEIYNELPDFVLFWDKDIYLAQRLENMGVRVFNWHMRLRFVIIKLYSYSVI